MLTESPKWLQATYLHGIENDTKLIHTRTRQEGAFPKNTKNNHYVKKTLQEKR